LLSSSPRFPNSNRDLVLTRLNHHAVPTTLYYRAVSALSTKCNVVIVDSVHIEYQRKIHDNVVSVEATGGVYIDHLVT